MSYLLSLDSDEEEEEEAAAKGAALLEKKTVESVKTEEQELRVLL